MKHGRLRQCRERGLRLRNIAPIRSDRSAARQFRAHSRCAFRRRLWRAALRDRGRSQHPLALSSTKQSTGPTMVQIAVSRTRLLCPVELRGGQTYSTASVTALLSQTIGLFSVMIPSSHERRNRDVRVGSIASVRLGARRVPNTSISGRWSALGAPAAGPFATDRRCRRRVCFPVPRNDDGPELVENLGVSVGRPAPRRGAPGPADARPAGRSPHPPCAGPSLSAPQGRRGLG